MPVTVLARRRAAILCSGAAILTGVAGCGAATTSSSSISGNNLVVYSSVPSSQPDVYKAEALALKQQGAKVGKSVTVVLKPPMTADTTAQIAQNAREAL